MEKLSLAFFLSLAALSNGLMFKLPVNSEKCLKEEIHKDVLVKGEYEVSPVVGVKVDLKVRI